MKLLISLISCMHLVLCMFWTLRRLSGLGRHLEISVLCISRQELPRAVCFGIIFKKSLMTCQREAPAADTACWVKAVSTALLMAFTDLLCCRRYEAVKGCIAVRSLLDCWVTNQCVREMKLLKLLSNVLNTSGRQGVLCWKHNNNKHSLFSC